MEMNREEDELYDSDFEDSDPGYVSNEGDPTFVVDDDLEDSDKEEIEASRSRVELDVFLYDLCHHPVAYEGNKDEVIRDDGCHEEINEVDVEDEQEADLQYGIHDPKTSWKHVKPHLGERYANIEELRFCLTNYAVANGYPLTVTKSSRERLQVKCGTDKKGIRCVFKLWASWMKQERSFQIKGLNEKHTCIREFKHGTLVNPNWIAKQFLKKLSARPRMKCIQIVEDVKKKFLCEVSIGQCFRAKRKALEIINGKLIEHYERVWDYANEILRSNPGSTAKVCVQVNPDGKTYFHRMYVCFKALKEGWSRGCRRIIGLDGCFLKGQCKGELITTIGRDENNQVFPIVWAVVDVENKVNWKWFLELLCDYLGLQLGGGLILHLFHLLNWVHNVYGLIEAVKEVLPSVKHRQCARHVFPNFKKAYNGVEYTRFWSILASEALLFEVRLGFEAYQVDVEQGFCTCRLWEISGIPCVHACAVMNYTHQQPETLISNYFSKTMFDQTYRGNIKPLNDNMMWEKHHISNLSLQLQGECQVGQLQKEKGISLKMMVNKGAWGIQITSIKTEKIVKTRAKPAKPTRAKPVKSRDKPTKAICLKACAGRGNCFSGNVQGLVDVTLVKQYDLPTAQDLLQSGYTPTEVYAAIKDPVEIVVHPVDNMESQSTTDVMFEGTEEGGVKETQEEAVNETQEEGVEETQEQGVQETQQQLRVRKRSERIVKTKLRKQVKDVAGGVSGNLGHKFPHLLLVPQIRKLIIIPFKIGAVFFLIKKMLAAKVPSSRIAHTRRNLKSRTSSTVTPPKGLIPHSPGL
ncbi:hypothetical protein LXL04_017456 [Taraxacum kok-saghyz]